MSGDAGDDRQIPAANPEVRFCWTICCNVSNGDPATDMPAVMMALGATYRLKGAGGERDVAARDFYEGTFVTALNEGELLASVSIPMPAERHGCAYEKQKRKMGDYATAAACVVLTLSAGTCDTAAIALTNVAGTPLFAAAASQALIGTPVDAAAIGEAVRRARAICSPSADGRGPAEFRTHVAGIMVQRAIARARERAA